MKLYFALLGFIFLFFSCNSSKEKENINTEKEFVFDMHEPSEMTHLMLSMYDFNEKIKKKIIEGDSLGEFPREFLDIFTAELTDNKPQNDLFKAYSKVYIDQERAIFDRSNKVPLKNRYNNAINTCISCHTTECVGPIPKIKKLLIN